MVLAFNGAIPHIPFHLRSSSLHAQPRERLVCIRYASLKLIPGFGTPFRFVLTVQLRRKVEGRIYSENRKATSRNQKVSSEDAEGFFQRGLAFYARKLPKNGAASLMDLPEFV